MDSMVNVLASKKNEGYHQILYFFFQDYIFQLPEEERRKFIERGFFRKIKAALITLALSQKRNASEIEVERLKPVLTGKKWVFVFGRNNYEATKFLGDDGFVFVTDSRRNYQTTHDVVLLPIRRKLTNFLRFFSLMNYLSKTEKKTPEIWDAIFSSMGWLESFEEIIDIYKPKVIVFSNDHSMVPRALLIAAKRKQTPTAYIQHASISSYLPPLAFDLSLLEGNDALDKYKMKGGVQGKVELVGMPRFDSYVQRKKTAMSDKIETIGVAFNTVDSLENISSAVHALKKSNPELRIIVRRHPKDDRSFHAVMNTTSANVEFSDSRSEGPFDFILKCDLLVAGDSSIHLEAKMLNVDSVYFNFSESDSTHDLYGYIKSGLVQKMNTEQELVAYVKDYSTAKTNSASLVQYYNAAWGSSFEGASGKYATEKLKDFLKE